jgi:hypothetical protein
MKTMDPDLNVDYVRRAYQTAEPSVREKFNRMYPEAKALGESMYAQGQTGTGSDMNTKKVGQKGANINVSADIASEAPTDLNASMRQLEDGLRNATRAEDRILIQEEMARVREAQAAEAAGAGKMAVDRARSNIAELQKELKKASTPEMRQVLEGEIRRNEQILAGAPMQEAPDSVAAKVDNSAEIQTLKRFIENPGTNATERGRARMRLAELEREAGNTKMPALQRNYDGVSLPAGESAPKGAYVTTAPALTPPSIPAELPRVDIQREKVTQVDAQGEPPLSLESREARINEVLNEPNVRHRLQQIQQADAQKFPDKKDTPERKSFLEGALADLFGDTGLFNKQELIRFSVLAAGGLLTGGSVGGSFRYAGLDTLRHSDARRAQERATTKAQELAKAQIQKELRADLRRMDADSIKALDKKAPDVQAQAIDWMNQAKALELQGKYESSRDLYRRANMLLTASPNVDDAGSGSLGKLQGHE